MSEPKDREPKDPYRLKWICHQNGNGCFNETHRPRWELMRVRLPGRVKLGDVDGILHHGRSLLIMEFKGNGGKIPGGQEWLYRSASEYNGITGVVIDGEAYKMVCNRAKIYHRGWESEWFDTSLEGLNELVGLWWAWADQDHYEKIVQERWSYSGQVRP